MAPTAANFVLGRLTGERHPDVPVERAAADLERRQQHESGIARTASEQERQVGEEGRSDGRSPTSYCDQSVFSPVGNITCGNTLRTSPDLRAPGTRAFDMSLFEALRARERGAVGFRAEAFNAMNHPVWNGPGMTVTDPDSFGIITSEVGQRRQIEWALKVSF